MPDARMRRRVQLIAMTMACSALAGVAMAQDMPPAVTPDLPPAATPATPPGLQTAAVPQPATPTATAPAPAAQTLSQAQLDQLVAPIALYPDPVLSQVLMASTYPLEIVEASRWLSDPANKALKGDALTAALKDKNWDPSVMALVPFPNVLATLADKIEWTEHLGDAFLAQQDDVMNAVQRLRHEAIQAGTLKQTPQCHCVIQTSGETISILPAAPTEVCVPVYNPTVAYGAWPEPAYPPVIFPPPPGFVFAPDVAIGFFPVIELAAFGPLWGWGSIDWGGHHILIDNGRFDALAPNHAAFAGGVWVHDPAHRGGVPYRSAAVTARFGAARVAAMTAAGRAGLAREPGGGEHVAVLRGGAPGGHPGAFEGHPGRFGGFASPGVVRGAGGHTAAAFHAGGVARGPGPMHGRGPIGHAQFSPGGSHGFGGGPRGGGAPHGGGGGDRHR